MADLDEYLKVMDTVIDDLAKMAKIPIYYLSPVEDLQHFTYDSMYLRAINA